MSSKISELANMVALTGAEKLTGLQGGANLNATVSQIADYLGALPTMLYKGTADASAIDEQAATGETVFNNGDVYRVTVAAAAPHAFSDIAEDLAVGDWVVYNGATWDKQDGTDPSAAETKIAYESNANTNAFTDAEKTNLGNQSGTNTGDETAGSIKTKYESNADTNAFTDAEKTNLGNQSGTNTGDETAGSIKTKYESNADTNAFTDAEKTNLGNQSGTNTGDETAGSIKTKYESNADTNAFTDFKQDKLSYIRNGPTFDLNTVTYTGKSFDTSGQVNNPFGLYIRADGVKMYVLDIDLADNLGDRVFEYDLTIPNDVTSAVYTGNSFSFTAQDISPSGVSFKTDGTKMYMAGGSTDDVFQYTLSTPWNVSTASYDSVFLNASPQDTSLQDVFFKQDGTILWTVGAANNRVYQYNVASPWDLSTATYSSKSFSVGAQDGTPADVYISDDGLLMYLVGFNSDSVHEYNLGVAFDVTTAALNVSLDISSESDLASGISFTGNGSGFITSDSGANAVFQYEALQATAGYTQAEKDKLDGIASGAQVNTIDSDPSGVTGADQVINVMSLTQAEYDAIVTKDAATLYVIVG